MHASVQSTFQIRFGTHTIVGDMISDSSAPQVLILHGAGNSHRKRFQLFRENLFSHGISSVAFDFLGHGDSGGDLKRSSLRSRTQQACQIIESLNLKMPLSIIGASMSAYTAVTLLKYYEIEKLILMVPAMYTSKAYGVAFNNGFTEIIREPGSWEHSDAWDILAQYGGDLLVIAAENDRVIPEGVIRRIYDSAMNARTRKLYVAPRASHFIFTDLRSSNPEEFDRAFRLITGMLKSSGKTPS